MAADGADPWATWQANQTEVPAAQPGQAAGDLGEAPRGPAVQEPASVPQGPNGADQPPTPPGADRQSTGDWQEWQWSSWRPQQTMQGDGMPPTDGQDGDGPRAGWNGTTPSGNDAGRRSSDTSTTAGSWRPGGWYWSSTWQGQWTADEWRQWTAERAHWGGGSTASSATHSGSGSVDGSGAAAAAPGMDGTSPTTRPCMPSATRTSTTPTTRCDEHAGAGPPNVPGGRGPSEKLLIPSFSGEGEGGELGSSARSYLRQICAWQRMTKLAPNQQALVLYQNLSGAAWINSEALDVEDLATDNGVEVLREWVRQHYLDVEVTSIGRSLSDLFRKLKRRPNQTFRDYTAEYNRLLARVVECGCVLPDVATAWLYVDRANLDEVTEVSLLASVGNKYALRALQQAAIILDRSMRKPWERVGKGDGRRPQLVHHTEDIEAEDHHDVDPREGSDVEPPDQDDLLQDNEDLYVTYMTAKARYRDAAKSRGLDKVELADVKRTAEERIKAAKARSHCAACGQKGHWHRDAVCPKAKNGATPGGKPQTIHVTNEIYELTVAGAGGLLAILDTACSKTVVGTGWVQQYLNYTKDKAYNNLDFIYERDAFRFGAAAKIYEAHYSTIILAPIGKTWIAIKAAVIHGDIPLLLSRPLLAKLGGILDLGNNKVDFRALGSGELELLATPSGHPAIRVDHKCPQEPDLASIPKVWEAHGSAVLEPRQVYMVGSLSAEGPEDHPECPQIFYHKRSIDPALRELLLADSFNVDVFLAWWSSSNVTDFWVESPTKLVRVHVTPRKTFFDPRKWNTDLTATKDLLLQSLGDLRETWGIACVSRRSLSPVSEVWRMQQSGSYPTLWIGRSVFNRASTSQAGPNSSVPPAVHELVAPAADMEDDEIATLGRVQQTPHCDLAQVDLPGATRGVERAQGEGQWCAAKGADEDVPGGTEGRSQPLGARHNREGNTRGTPVADQGHVGARGHRHDDREVPGDIVQGHPRQLRAVGIGRGEGKWGQHARGSEEVCDLAPEVPHGKGHGSEVEDRVLREPGARREDPTASNERDRVVFILGNGDRGQSAKGADSDTEGKRVHPNPKATVLASDQRRGRGDDGDGAGGEPASARGDPCFGKSAGDLEGCSQDCTGTPTMRSDTDIADKRRHHRGNDFIHDIHDINDEHHEEYESCTSGTGDMDEEGHVIFATKQEIADHANKNTSLGHAGERKAEQALRNGIFDYDTLEKILEEYDFTAGLKRPSVHFEGGQRCVLGYYAFGNFKGISRKTVRWPHLSQYVNAFLRAQWGEDDEMPPWTSLYIQRNLAAGIHTDKNNLKGSTNITTSFGDHSGGELWVAQPGGGAWRRDRNGDEIEGILLHSKGQLCEFDPRCKHQVEPWTGNRWSVVAYCARTCPEATNPERKLLRELGCPRRVQRQGDGTKVQRGLLWGNYIVSDRRLPPGDRGARRGDQQQHRLPPGD